MTLRTIIPPDNPALRKKARKVTAFTPALKTLFDDMVETMREAPGVGLAAPQVAVSQRVIVVEYAPEPEESEEPQKPKLFRLVNPEIAKASEATELGAEGCLSIPGYQAQLKRSLQVVVKALNREGKPFRIKGEELLAQVLEHEIDHLNGVLYIDRLESPDMLKKVEEEKDGEEAHAQ